MSKAAELMRLLGITLFSMLIIGTGGYFITHFDALFQPETHTTHTTAQPYTFQEYAVLQQQYAESIQHEILHLIEPVVGVGKVRVSAHVDLNFKNLTQKDHVLVPDTLVVEKDITTHERGQVIKKETNYAFSTQTTTTQSLNGIVQKQFISVLIDGETQNGTNGMAIYQPRTTGEMATYTALIKAVVGFDAERGDIIEVLNLPFSDPETTWWGLTPKIWIKTGAWIFLCLCALILIIGFIVPMMRVLIAPRNTQNISHTKEDSLRDKIQTFFYQQPDQALSLVKNWLYTPISEGRNELAPGQKLAVLLLALGDKTTRRIFNQLTPEEVRKISLTMAELGTVPPLLVQRVLNDFWRAIQGQSEIVGCPERIQQILTQQNRGDHFSDLLSAIPQDIFIWEKLHAIDVAVLAKHMEPFSPEITAMILYHLSSDKAGKIMGLMSNEYTTKVLMHLSHLGKIHIKSRQKIEQQAIASAREIIAQTRFPSSTKKASDILRHMDAEVESRIMKSLSDSDPGLAQQMTGHLLQFEDISKWDDASLRILLKHTDRTTAMRALRGASDVLKSAFARNMSPQTWTELVRDMGKLQNISVDEINKAQSVIVKTAQNLIWHKKVTPILSH